MGRRGASAGVAPDRTAGGDAHDCEWGPHDTAARPSRLPETPWSTWRETDHTARAERGVVVDTDELFQVAPHRFADR